MVLSELKFKTTKEIKVPKRTIDQVIGQEKAIDIVKKAARQKRNVLLIGNPGTGKSMIGQSLAELLPREKLTDILCFPNPRDENTPLIKEVPAGKGKDIITSNLMRTLKTNDSRGWISLIAFFFVIAVVQFAIDWVVGQERSDILKAADRIAGTMFLLAMLLVLMVIFATYRLRQQSKMGITGPKILIDNSETKNAPFIDATGTHEGALLGDIKHDPFQCFSPNDEILCKEGNELRRVSFKEFVDEQIRNNNIYTQNDYKAVFLPEKKYFTLGFNKNKPELAEVLSVNLRNYYGKLIKISTHNSSITVTPNHKIAVLKNGKPEFIKASDLMEGQEIITLSDEIISEKDIIKTFSNRDQEQVELYNKFIKKQEMKNETAKI